MKKLLLLLLLAVVQGFVTSAQTTQLFIEDFNTPSITTFTLNGIGPLGASAGNNEWTLNSNYTGGGGYGNTMTEDSTYSGTIGSAPFSRYLHIHDNFSGITNCNYNATSPSDQFSYMTNGMCTLGMDSVHYSFFYLGDGDSTNAWGEVWYSIDNGAWIQDLTTVKYISKYKWKYQDLTNPVFANKFNVRFGFRWINAVGSPPTGQSFAIDDIDAVGYYTGSGLGGVTMTVDSVSPNPICPGNYLLIYWHLSDTLCDGTYQIMLSTATGAFPTTSIWVGNIYYPQTSGLFAIIIPTTTPPGTCYKIRISRTSPAPLITGIASACFVIPVCPNIITTLQPVVTMDTNAVCIGSDIDIPFFSTGVYTFNTYTAELSDSNGVFPAIPTVVGSAFNSTTYDPALGSPPGTVSGQIPLVPPGCGYYIRIVSSSPVAIGAPWGPFCIRECDIETNHKQDLHFCVTDCSAAPLGADTTIFVGANSWDTLSHYGPTNLFTTQMLSMMTFAPIGPLGVLGSVMSDHDTTLHIHIPCKDSLGPLGFPGTNYFRIVATETSTPDNALGTIIRLTVGAPHANAEIITPYDYATFTPRDTFCVGDVVALFFSPYNYSDHSTYLWQCNAINGGNPFVSPSGANSNSLYVNLGGTGFLTFKVQETSYGCIGIWSPMITIYVLGPPIVSISGPTAICVGDTVHYLVPFFANTYYSWHWDGGVPYNIANNEIFSQYDTAGTYHVNMSAINQCGSATSSHVVIVKNYPIVNTNNDTTICAGNSVTLATNTGTGYLYNWSNIAGGTVASTASTTVTPTVSTSYQILVTGPAACKTRDTVDVTVQTATSGEFPDSLCPTDGIPITLMADSLGTYLWSTGATSQSITVTDTGTFTVSIMEPGRVCARVVTFRITADDCLNLELPNVFTPGSSGGTNDFFSAILTGPYEKFIIKIYNRWGEVVYESSDPYFKWDGKNKKGHPCSDGTYYYILQAGQNSGEKNTTLKGFIQLIR